MYTQQDHDALALAHDLMAWTSELINGVLDRNPMSINTQTVSLLCEAIHDVDIADRYMGWQPSAKHQHEAWMIQDGYCGACGDTVKQEGKTA